MGINEMNGIVRLVRNGQFVDWWDNGCIYTEKKLPLVLAIKYCREQNYELDMDGDAEYGRFQVTVLA